jgi:predicted membrane-bound spermidine synthase
MGRTNTHKRRKSLNLSSAVGYIVRHLKASSTPNLEIGSSPSWQVGLLLFGSGLCALIYQTVWLREFRLIFGGSTAATAAVLGIFMGGLGLGGLLLGPRVDDSARPLRFYAQLELLIAGSAALTPALVWLVRQAYLMTSGSVSLGPGLATILRLLFAALVLVVPTLAMGGTLPAAARAVATETDAIRRRIALLYAANTLGAVSGAVLATFVLLEHYGNRRTLWLASTLNAAVALAALQLARRATHSGFSHRRERAQGAKSEIEDREVKNRNPQSRIENPRSEPERNLPEARTPGVRSSAGGPRGDRDERANSNSALYTRFVYLAAGLSGFAFFLMELVWYRMLSPLLGGSVFTFGLILAVALLGVGSGGFVYTLGRQRSLPSLRGLALTFGLEALCLAIPFALGDRVALLALSFRRLAEVSFAATALGWTLIAALVVFPASLVAGLQFPLLIALLGEGRDRVGRQVGLACAWNTLGAIAGSLAGGFGLLPLLSAPGAWRAVVVLLSLLSVVALALHTFCGARAPSRDFMRAVAEVLSRRSARSRLKRLTRPNGSEVAPGAPPLAREAHALPGLCEGFGLTMTALSCLLLFSTGPTAAWRHSGIGAGRIDQFSRASRTELDDVTHFWRRICQWETDGVESSVALLADRALAFYINGKNDGNARSDAGTVIMGGLIGAILHPNPAKALVIGLGTGSTAGWLGAVPSIERVDVVELEPAVLRVAQACGAVNHDALHNPKVHIAIGDGREILAVLREKYDVIFSEPSNPYRAGIASLFTREFYQTTASKLTDRGLFLQWVQAYEVDRPTIQTAYATLVAVFPVVEAWQTKAGDLLFVGALRPIAYDAAALRQRIQQEPFRAALANAWRVTDLEGFLAHFLSADSLAREVASAPGIALNTDDRTVMEFRFGRAVALTARFNIRQWLELARARRADRPQVVNGEVDWGRVEDERLSLFAIDSVEPWATAGFTDDQLRRAQAKINFVKNDFKTALAAWRGQPKAPGDLTELLLLAESLADAADEEALVYIEKLRTVQPAEAEVITARLRWRQGRWEEATAALEASFLRYRSDPWPLPALMQRALEVAQAVAREAPDKNLARRLCQALSEPFAVYLWNQIRLGRRLEIAVDSGDPDLLKQALEAFEPHVPWQRHFLERRLACYSLLGDPRTADAERDLQQFRLEQDRK